jgi:hypothetical protein
MQQSTALHQGKPQQWAAAILGGQFFQSVGGISRLRAVGKHHLVTASTARRLRVARCSAFVARFM